MRIPTDVQLSVQAALSELDQRATRLEGEAGAGLTRDQVMRLIQEVLDAQQPTPDGSTGTGNFPPTGDIMRPSGPSHMHGYVPDPGMASTLSSTGSPGPANSQAGTSQVLHEDGKWKELLSGRLLDITNTGDPIDKFQLSGALSVLGPIAASAGWFSDLIVEGPIECRVPYVILTHTANQSITTATETALAFDTELAKTEAGLHSTTVNNTRITPTRAGLWLVFAGGRWASSTLGTIRDTYIKKSNTTYQAIDGRHPPNAVLDYTLMTIRRYATTDYIEHRVFQDSGGALNLQVNTEWSPIFGAIWLAA